MKIKVSEATGAALDWAVAKCESIEVEYLNDGITRCLLRVSPLTGRYSPSADWSQGGPIIERELIDVQSKFNSSIVPKSQWYWQASTVNEDDVAYWFDGPTPLIAAMRTFVASKLGDEVDVPEELT